LLSKSRNDSANTTDNHKIFCNEGELGPINRLSNIISNNNGTAKMR
jgi:hypothetical protein